MAPKTEEDIDGLRKAWKQLYATTLPQLARSKDAAQAKWPVTFGHCFARIILDNTIGKGEQQWDKIISEPAMENMSHDQLKAAIDLGERIRAGKVDLVDLDRRSLEAREKTETTYENEDGALEQKGMKRKRHEQGTKQSPNSPKKQKHRDTKKQSTLVFASSDGKDWTQLPSPAASPDSHSNQRSQLEKSLNTTSTLSPALMRSTLQRIDSATITPFRKRLYTSLLSVPKGEYTTYAALADHLGSSARAVGNGMRNNPFAPDVPCHRVLASDGTLGGFCGEWGRENKGQKGYLPKQNEKIRLLESEGVKFDSTGHVKGRLWRGFWDREQFENELSNMK